MKNINVAILGATGLVGHEFVHILKQRNFPMTSLRLLASARSAGKVIAVGTEEFKVSEALHNPFENIDIALFSAGSDTSKHFAPLAVKSGAIVIDNSAAYRMEADVPLVIPEVNPDDINSHHGIIANPNCSTIQMVTALAPLHNVNPIKRVIVDTYQAVAGTGKAAIEELSQQTEFVLNGKEVFPHVYPHRIAFNLLPHIDVFLDNGYTKEEWKLIQETRKIMHAPDMAISATCVRVPVFIGHSEAVHIQFTKPMSPETAGEILSNAPGVKVMDDPDISLYPTPVMAADSDDVYVGRLRTDYSHSNGLAMWIVSDNLRKGAALNAVQIAEEIISQEIL